jgi:(p)ppGpp synthase/HD superfamily hydrolase
VRKGTRLPYLTHPANVAIILTRYGQDEDTVVAGILYDVVGDCVRENFTRAMLEQRIGDKFGSEALDMVLAVTPRGIDDSGVELSPDERREDFLERLGHADNRARWVCAADMLHNASTILADLKRTIDAGTIWSRFAAGRDGTVRWFRRVHDRLLAVGFSAPIVQELDGAVRGLEEFAERETPVAH